MNYNRPPMYRLWEHMIERCVSPTCANYRKYGAKGIRVCDRWRHSFAAFVEDMGPRPTPKHTLDRIDPAGHYEPGNCRWATYAEQNRHRVGHTKLDEQAVHEIRCARALGIPGTWLGRLYGVESGYIYKVAKGLIWRDVV